MSFPEASAVYCDEARDAERACRAFVRARCLLRGVRRLGLAVSGGADSAALFHLLLPLCRARGVGVTVLHADHGLRPESAEEAAFVRALSESQGISLLCAELDVSARKRPGESLEMAARAARHAFYADCCRRAELDAVATGHQADDLAESLLMRLARGAGCSGLSALLPRAPAAPELAARAGRPYLIVRPLLCLSSRALRCWLSERGLAWREDASNANLSIPRNRVRHEALPRLEAAWGRPVRQALCRSAELLREEDALLEALAGRRLRAVARDAALDLRGLARTPLALRRRLLRRWLIAQGLPEAAGFDSVARLIASSALKAAPPLQLSEGCRAVFREGQLSLDLNPPPPPSDALLPQRGRLRWGRLEIDVEPFQGVASEASGIGRYPAVCTLSAAHVAESPLVVRARRPGDRIAPTGLRGSKKLHDLLVDEKVPRDERDSVPVLACGDEVAWVPGYRVARGYAVPSPGAASLRITVRALT